MTDASSELAAIRQRTSTLLTPRSHATRQKLRDAVRALVSEGAEINVSTVAARAEVSRSTFYSHFADLDELAVDALGEDLRNQPFSVGGLVEVYQRNRNFYRRLLAETGSRRMMEKTVEFTALALLERAGLDAAVSQEILGEALFTAWGFIGTLNAWLRSEDPLDVAELEEFLRSQLPETLSRRR